jgi:hypothetical protein
VELHVRVVTNGQGERPPVGTPVRIEVRDVTEQDAASTLIIATDTRVGDDGDNGDDGVALATAVIDLADDAVAPQRDLILWARVATSGTERVASGDWITMQSVPVRTPGAVAGAALDIEVRPVA